MKKFAGVALAGRGAAGNADSVSTQWQCACMRTPTPVMILLYCFWFECFNCIRRITMRNKTMAVGVVGIVVGVLLSTAVVLAGNLNPSAGPTVPDSADVHAGADLYPPLRWRRRHEDDDVHRAEQRAGQHDAYAGRDMRWLCLPGFPRPGRPHSTPPVTTATWRKAWPGRTRVLSPAQRGS